MSRSAPAVEGSPAPAAAAPGAAGALPSGLGPGGAGYAAAWRFSDPDRSLPAHPFLGYSPGSEDDLAAVIGHRIEATGQGASTGASSG